MTICFDGCDYKYEIESVTKLFFPVEHFGFLFGSPEMYDIKDDRIIISQKRNKLSVSVKYRESEKCSAVSLENESDGETEAARELFKILSVLTGTAPKWGCLTGIRPVKKYNEKRNGGMDERDIKKLLSEKYFVSDEKINLCSFVSETQRAPLERERKNSFSLYVSIPFCPTRCAYCSFVSHSIKKSGAKLIPVYTEKLCRELELTAEIAERLDLTMQTIYIGGGTPTAIPAENLDKIMEKIEKCFDISAADEYTVEAGRADTITEEKLSVIKNRGANRISVNPQSMNDSVLKACQRSHTADDVIKAYEIAKKIGFDSINMDVIAGLPSDTPESFRNTLDTLTDLAPENITVHTLTVKRSADLYSDRENVKKNVSPISADEMVSYAERILPENGYAPYYLYRQKNTVGNLENVGYSKKGHESLYNIFIMDETQTILAAGASGSTKLVNNETGLIRRVINYKYPYEYISDFDKMIGKKEREIFGV